VHEEARQGDGKEILELPRGDYEDEAEDRQIENGYPKKNAKAGAQKVAWRPKKHKCG